MKLPFPGWEPSAGGPQIDVHALRPEELDEVASTLRHRIVATDRFDRQRRGECLYAIAWEERRAIGQLLLHWRRPPAVRIAPAIDALPYVEDLFVLPAARRRGAGTALLDAAAAAAAARGSPGLSLAVSVDNDPARRLYSRLGYVDAGTPAHLQPTSEHAADGAVRSRQETVIDLVHWLDPKLRAPAPS